MTTAEPTDDATGVRRDDSRDEPRLLHSSRDGASRSTCERCGHRPAVYRVLADATKSLAACVYCASLLMSPGLDPDGV